MKDVFIIDGVRTAIGSFGGTLSAVRTDDLATEAIKGLIKNNPKLDLDSIEDVILGCANQAGEDNRNVARMAGLMAGLPVHSGGETVNRLCSSGMAAVINSARAIKDGAGDVYVAGGVENMTREARGLFPKRQHLLVVMRKCSTLRLGGVLSIRS